MAEVKFYDDDGYLGSLPPFLKIQLRDYFYQNPGPDVQWLCQIAVETGWCFT